MMRLATILAALLALAVAPVSVPSAPQKPPTPAATTTTVMDRIRAEFDAAIAPGVADSTTARLGRFLRAHPRHPLAGNAHFELGTLDYARGDYGAAHERFRRARAGALVDEARYWEGLTAFALGRPREARDAVLGVARSRRDVARRWDSAYLVALSWGQEGRRPEALAAYRTLLDLPPGSAQAAALYQAQRLAESLARSEDAAEWGRRLLASFPNSPEATSFRAESTAPATAVPVGAGGAPGRAGVRPVPGKPTSSR